MTFPFSTALTLRLAGGLALAALALAAAVSEFWPREGARPRAIRGRAVAGEFDSSAAADVAGVAEDDAAWLAAMERLERRVAAGAERARESVLALEYKANGAPAGARRVATGVVIDAMGSVLSIRIEPPAGSTGSANDDEGPARIVARDALGRRHVAEWVAADPDTGLTLLRIPTGAPRPIEPADEGPKLGGRVFVVGNPFGLGQSVSRGQISGLNRSLELHSQPLHGLIQVQTPLFPGDSGAVVADFQGRWLGLIRGGLAPPTPTPATATEGDLTRRSSDLGFAIPAERALWIAARLRDQGKVDRAYLGVRLEPDSDDGEPGNNGARLRDVLPDTPAARGGLQIGDRIVAFDGQPIRSALELTERLDRSPAHLRVQLEVVRGEGADRRAHGLWIQTASRPDPLVPAAVGAPLEVVPTAATITEPPRAEEIQPPLPSALIDRLERLEKRIERLERAAPAGP